MAEHDGGPGLGSAGEGSAGEIAEARQERTTKAQATVDTATGGDLPTFDAKAFYEWVKAQGHDIDATAYAIDQPTWPTSPYQRTASPMELLCHIIRHDGQDWPRMLDGTIRELIGYNSDLRVCVKRIGTREVEFKTEWFM